VAQKLQKEITNLFCSELTLADRHKQNQELLLLLYLTLCRRVWSMNRVSLVDEDGEIK